MSDDPKPLADFLTGVGMDALRAFHATRLDQPRDGWDVERGVRVAGEAQAVSVQRISAARDAAVAENKWLRVQQAIDQGAAIAYRDKYRATVTALDTARADALAPILALHQRRSASSIWPARCTHDDKDWPCPTVVAARAATPAPGGAR